MKKCTQFSMYDEILNKLNSINNSLRNINKKVKLLTLLNRAKSEYDKNNTAECIRVCNEILENNPTSSVAYRGIGCSFQAQGDYQNALKNYNEALKYSKHKEIEYTLIGIVYYLENNYEEAIQYYNLAIEENDTYEDAYEGKNQAMLEHHLSILDLQDNLIEKELRSFY